MFLISIWALGFSVHTNFFSTDAPGNLVDNLLDRMQHYTNDLEAMVLKRTEQYKEEKKRAEDLLYSMLPQWVYMYYFTRINMN